MKTQFIASDVKNVLQVEFCMQKDTDEYGMTGTGLFVVNPPWQLTQQLEVIMPYLKDKLGDNQHTNTAKLVLACNCPVLVVPKSYSEYNLVNIALVIGKEEIDDTKRLGTLLMIARKFNAKVHVLTVENEPVLYGYSKEEEKNESAIEYYLETFYQERAFIKNDDILDGINTYGIKNEIDLVTILPRNHAESGKPSEAELTQRLILNSKIPLLILE